MKRKLLLKVIPIGICFGVLLGVAFGQSGHFVNLIWSASSDSTAANPGTVTVYRASGACPATGIGSLSYTALTTTAPAGGPYSDTSVTVGTWCYYVTATIGGATSGPSNTVQAVILPLAPSSLKVGSSQ